MNLLLVSMPYAKFDSDWFARVPNVNLGCAAASLRRAGHRAASFHFHLDFRLFAAGLGERRRERFGRLAARGVEYFSLDYLFATLLFPDECRRSRQALASRLEPLRLDPDDLDDLAEAASSYLDRCADTMAPALAGADAVAFSCSHFQLSASLLLARRLKEAHGDLRVIFGGKDCAGGSGLQIMGRFPFVDHVATSECEATLLAFADRPADSAAPPAGLLHRARKGRAGRGPDLPPADLDAAPFPEYDLETLPLPPEELILPLELGRGCAWGRCSFCPDRVYGLGRRVKTPERVAAEIAHYRSLSPALTRFLILDADALKDPPGIGRLADLLAGEELTLVFGELRAEHLDRRTLASLMALGRWGSHFQVGVESFSDRLLELMNKGTDALTNVRAVKAAAELGAPLQFNVITSFPRMEAGDLEENLRVMDMTAHLLVRENIRLYPSEFYLPPDCDIFDRAGHFHVRKTRESTFSALFEGADFHALGNYPHYVAFENQEEQMRMSAAIRRRIEELGRLAPADEALEWSAGDGGLVVRRRRRGRCEEWRFDGTEAGAYLAAVERIRGVGEVAAELRMRQGDLRLFLEAAERDGLVLFSADRACYLSLATET